MVQYLSPLEYAFMMHEETPWMVKFDLVGLAGLPGSAINNFQFVNTSIKFDFERRIKNNFTINTSFQYSFYYSKPISFNGSSFGSTTKNKFDFLVEARWYYNMETRVMEKKQKRNLSGNYIGFGLGYSFNKIVENYEIEPSIPSFPDLFPRNEIKQAIPLFIKWGIQRRFLKRGYIDFGLKTGANINLGLSSGFNPNLPFYFLESFVNAGIALARDHNKLQRDKLCDVLRCYKSEQFLLKTNLNELFKFTVIDLGTENSHNISVNPNIAAEFKIGKSPFSISGIINILYRGSYSKLRMINSIATLFSLQGRWYYNLNRRVIKGKSGNGLSANYIGLGASYGFNYDSWKYSGQYNSFNINESTDLNYYYIITGIQRLLSDHFYYDVNIGFGYSLVRPNGNSIPHEKNSELKYTIGLDIGYRF
jgi:hypothetical protein